MTNTFKGSRFEEVTKLLLEEYLQEKLEEQKKVAIGFEEKREHRFDLGNSNYLRECKAYEWTKDNNSPSAKLSTLRETLYYFFLAPKNYKKILVLKKSGVKNGETVLDYFIRLNYHLIPKGVEIFEIDMDKKLLVKKEINKTEILKNTEEKVVIVTRKNKKTDNPSVDEVRAYIKKQLDDLKAKGVKEYEIEAGNIVREMVIINATPTVCSAMRSCGYDYEEIYSPPKKNGTRLRFKYLLSLWKSLF